MAGVLILYGSQTGCSKDVAFSTARELKRFYVASRVSAMDDYDVMQLPTEPLVLFVCSTTGQGEVPDNMRNFWRFLRRADLPANALAGVSFSVFGLGDSGYPLFNAVARRLYQRILHLGGNSMCPRGLGDDQHDLGYDQALLPWMDAVTAYLLTVFPLPEGKEPVSKTTKPEPACTIEVVSSSLSPSSSSALLLDPQDMPAFGENSAGYVPLRARVVFNRRVTSEGHWQDVRHIAFQLPDGKGGPAASAYVPGDVLSVHPVNDPSVVRAFITGVLGRDPLDVVSWKLVDNGVHSALATGVPSSLSLFELCSVYLDVLGTPGRYFFNFLAAFSTNETDQERLGELGSAEYAEEYYKYNVQERRTYVEVLQQFTSARPPLEQLMSVIPRLQPRLFSIASSPSATPQGEVHILIAKVEYTTKFSRSKVGVMSHYLTNLRPASGGGDKDGQGQGEGEGDCSEEKHAASLFSDSVFVGIRRGTFDFEAAAKTGPLVFVGPGTGIVPFFSFCSEREAAQLSHAHISSEEESPPLVFFGNRNAASDFFFEDAWRRMEQTGVVRPLQMAFSRDQEEKVYVQHVMAAKENAELIYELLIEQNGVLFIAGNSNGMPGDVYQTLVAIVAAVGHKTEEEATKVVRAMQASQRYQVETWG
jgi:sulfite reductase alpha subunit-like flavoprotein